MSMTKTYRDVATIHQCGNSKIRNPIGWVGCTPRSTHGLISVMRTVYLAPASTRTRLRSISHSLER